MTLFKPVLARTHRECIPSTASPFFGFCLATAIHEPAHQQRLSTTQSLVLVATQPCGSAMDALMRSYSKIHSICLLSHAQDKRACSMCQGTWCTEQNGMWSASSSSSSSTRCTSINRAESWASRVTHGACIDLDLAHALTLTRRMH
jgi:hypothetical protein